MWLRMTQKREVKGPKMNPVISSILELEPETASRISWRILTWNSNKTLCSMPYFSASSGVRITLMSLLMNPEFCLLISEIFFSKNIFFICYCSLGSICNIEIGWSIGFLFTISKYVRSVDNYKYELNWENR